MIVICDTSPISGLLIIKHLHLLRELFGTIIIPPKVYQEIIALEQFGFSVQDILEADWIVKLGPQNQSLVQTLQEELDAGESEAIALAVEIQSDLIVIDENQGRTVAHTYGLRSTGTIGILLRAKDRELIKKVKPLLDLLIQEANFWIGDTFYQKTLMLAGESKD